MRTFVRSADFRESPAACVASAERSARRRGWYFSTEVLTGMWKNARAVLYHQQHMTQVDVMTLSKPTSEMVFPVSWALVTEAVYRRALMPMRRRSRCSSAAIETTSAG